MLLIKFIFFSFIKIFYVSRKLTIKCLVLGQAWDLRHESSKVKLEVLSGMLDACNKVSEEFRNTIKYNYAKNLSTEYKKLYLHYFTKYIK